METRSQNLEYEQLLTKCRVFVELLAIYLRCTPRVQEIVLDLVKLIESPATAEEDRERAYGTVAGTLLAFAGDEPTASGDRRYRLPIPAGTKAVMAEQKRAVAERLKSLREQKGWTQEELARRSGVGQSAISTIESGQCRPQAATVAKLAEALGVARNELGPVASRPRNGQPRTEDRPTNGQATRTHQAEKQP